MAVDLVATLRFNDNLTHGLRRARDQINHTSDSMNVLGRNNAFGSLTARVGGLVAALGGAVGAASLLNATIGEAMKFEGQQVLIEAMFDDKQASDSYLKMVQRVAEASPVLNSGEMMAASQGLVGLTKDVGQLEDAFKVIEKLSITNTTEGVEGAAFALRELQSGDVVSLAERFNIPKSVLNNLKALSFEEQLAGIDEYLNKTGLTAEAVDKYGQTSIAKWNQIKEKTQGILRNMGQDGSSALGKAFDGVLKGLDSGAFEGFIKAADSALGQAVTSMTAWIQTVDWTSVATNAKTALDTVVTTVQTAATFIKTHWDTIVFATKAVVTAFVALKTLSFVVGVFATVSSAVATGIRIFGALKTALNVAKTAFLIMRGVMLMFPGTWIIAAVGAVIAVGIALYKNWDTVKAKTAQLWAKFKETSAFKAVQSGLDKIIGVAKKVVDGFNALKSGVTNAMEKAKAAVFSSVNGIIDKVNWLIEKLNAIPGVNVPLVANVSYSGPEPGEMSAVNVRNDGPQMIGHHGGWNEIRTDRTPRLLHAGERVLTAVENDSYKQMMSSGLPNAIARMASLKPTPISNATTHNTNNVSNTTNAYSTTGDSVTKNYTTSAFELPAFNEVPILNAIRNLSNANGTAPIQESFKLDVTDIVTAIERMAKRAINVVVPQDGSANVVEQLRDIIAGNQQTLTATETQAISNSVSNSSFSESVSNVTTTDNSKKTTTQTIQPVVNLGGVHIDSKWDLDTMAGREQVAKKIALPITQEIAGLLKLYV